MTVVPRAVASALIAGLAACSGQGGPAHDPGKVVQAGPGQAKPASVPGRLYAVKGGALYRFSGTGVTQLTQGIRVKDPATSSDGRQLAFTQFGVEDSSIMLTDARSLQPRAIIPPSAAGDKLWAVEPAFAPDGRTLIFHTDRGKGTGPNDLAIWQLDLATERAQRLTTPMPYTGGHSDGVFRPGGGELVFTAFGYDGDPPAPVARLMWLSLSSFRQGSLSPTGERNLQPALSPDGHLLAYIHASAGRDDLYVAHLPATAGPVAQPYPTQAATLIQAGVVTRPVWAPDGHALAFLMLVNGSFDLFMLPVTTDATGVHPTGSPVALTRGSFFDADSRLAWSP